VTRETLAAHDGWTTTLVRDGQGAYVEKRMAPGLANTEALAAATGLDNPHVARVWGVEREDDGCVVTRQEYVEGETLEAKVREHGALGGTEACAIALDILDGLAALHARGILHRDVTPANVVLSDRGAVLIDLGIARRQDPDAGHDTRVLGTWGYAAPEQFGFAATDERSDVYAAGRVLLFMLSGRAPEDVDADAVSILRANLPCVMDAVDRMCAFEPGKRYQSAVEAAKALRIARAADGLVAPPEQAVHAAAGRAPVQPAPGAKNVLAWIALGFGLAAFLLFVDVGMTESNPGLPRYLYGMFCSVFAVAACAVPGYVIGSGLRGVWFFSAKPCTWKRALVALAIDLVVGFALLCGIVIAAY
jgi:hypothetical protein